MTDGLVLIGLAIVGIICVLGALHSIKQMEDFVRDNNGQ